MRYNKGKRIRLLQIQKACDLVKLKDANLYKAK